MRVLFFEQDEDTLCTHLSAEFGALSITAMSEVIDDHPEEGTQSDLWMETTSNEHAWMLLEDDPYVVTEVLVQGFGEALTFTDVQDVPKDGVLTQDFMTNIIIKYIDAIRNDSNTVH